MVRPDPALCALPGEYLFTALSAAIERRERERPGERVIRMGIGDVPGPLAPTVAREMERACARMGTAGGFHGYPPEGGWPFLREAVCAEYLRWGVSVAPDEVFISDGAKSDCGDLLELFASDSVIAVGECTYPAYALAAALAGRAGEWDAGSGRWSALVYLPCPREQGFLPDVPEEEADVVFLCSPSNPTGSAADRALLERWVAWANGRGSVLLFDAAYADYISDPALPRSIYEIPGACECAVEIRSFSKGAAFTGVRCGWSVLPHALRRGGVELAAVWKQRQSVRSNGVSYVSQAGACAALTPEGRREDQSAVTQCLHRAARLREGLRAAGYACWGGENAPYVWMEVPGGEDLAWAGRLLEEQAVAVTPGSGFGPGGRGYVRLSAFPGMEEIETAIARISRLAR